MSSVFSETDENYPRRGLHGRGVPPVPAGRLQQHHPEPHGDYPGHGPAQDRLQGSLESGKIKIIYVVQSQRAWFCT